MSCATRQRRPCGSQPSRPSNSISMAAFSQFRGSKGDKKMSSAPPVSWPCGPGEIIYSSTAGAQQHCEAVVQRANRLRCVICSPTDAYISNVYVISKNNKPDLLSPLGTIPILGGESTLKPMGVHYPCFGTDSEKTCLFIEREGESAGSTSKRALLMKRICPPVEQEGKLNEISSQFSRTSE